MPTPVQEYEILYALNEPLELLADRIFLGQMVNNPFELYSIAKIRLMIADLDAAQLSILEELLTLMAQAKTTEQSNAIGNKARLIKADVLEWSDNPAIGVSDLKQVYGDCLTRLRQIFGLRSIEALLQLYQAQSSRSGTKLLRS